MLDSQAILPRGAQDLVFSTTHWSVVLSAADSHAPDSQQALEDLCRSYWYPLYGFIRKRGSRPHEAEDLTQGFLCWLLESQHLRRADPNCGKFRSFLLVRLKHFLSDEWKRAGAQKRGGGQTIVSFGQELTERHLQVQSTDSFSPERWFDRQWGFTVLEHVLERMRKRYADRGKGELFENLHAYLGSGQARSYAESAKDLEMTEGAVKVAIHRLRKEFGELLRNEIAQTVVSPSEVDEEIRYLLQVTSE